MFSQARQQQEPEAKTSLAKAPGPVNKLQPPDVEQVSGFGVCCPMAYIYWNVRPELVHLDGFAVRWYGLIFGLAFLFGYFIVR